MKTARKTGYFSFFTWLYFFQLFFIERYISKFPASLLKKDTVALFILEKIDFITSK